MTCPTVSVLMTAYNREAYIGDAIESVLASIYRDFELVVVDDRSSDGTLEIARDYAERDDRVHVHINEKNLGDYGNRNQAASLARGKYLKYVDADDLLYPHALGHIVRSMEQFPEAGFGLTRTPSDLTPYPTQISPPNLYREHFFESARWDGSPLGAVIRRKAFHEVNGFSGRRYVGDMEMWLKLGARYPTVKLSGGFAFWRKHEMQETTYRYTDEEIKKDALLRYFTQIEALQTSHCPLPESEKREAMKIVRYRHAREIFWRLRQGRINVAATVFRRSDLTVAAFLKALLPRLN